MNLKLTDYVKIEHMKGLILSHLEGMGLKEQVRVMTDDDINKIINMMVMLAEELKIKENNDQRIEVLVSYIIALWARLIVDYGAELKEL